QSEVSIKVIAEFHYRFELIHPFQDGNGHIGRFVMLKQMLENNVESLMTNSGLKINSSNDSFLSPLKQFINISLALYPIS
ncbi:Fic family protein, partial [Clostridioides difficile]|uniref:Fic family protein n=1 Tax=Clostridioides difficile TaxID=1496 RepID=UPI003F8D6A78